MITEQKHEKQLLAALIWNKFAQASASMCGLAAFTPEFTHRCRELATAGAAGDKTRRGETGGYMFPAGPEWSCTTVNVLIAYSLKLPFFKFIRCSEITCFLKQKNLKAAFERCRDSYSRENNE